MAPILKTWKHLIIEEVESETNTMGVINIVYSPVSLIPMEAGKISLGGIISISVGFADLIFKLEGLFDYF